MFDAQIRSEVAKIARHLDVPTAALLAVIEVESGGRLLAKVQGRNEPLIRFEGNYFDRFLRGEDRHVAREQGLANPLPGRVKNPRSQAARWALVRKAIVINRVAALSSCSWGVGQVMGAHWKWLGYASVDALVVEARSGVAGQASLMARYIDRAKLAPAMREQDWAKFARVYNGPAYAKHGYHKKMAAAYARHVIESDSNQLPLADDVDAHESHPRFGSRGREVARMQKQLSGAGYLLVADGLFGLVTDRAVRQFQRDHMLNETGIFGPVEQAIVNGADASLASKAQAKIGVPLARATGSAIKSVNTLSQAISNIAKRVLSISRRLA